MYFGSLPGSVVTSLFHFSCLALPGALLVSSLFICYALSYGNPSVYIIAIQGGIHAGMEKIADRGTNGPRNFFRSPERMKRKKKKR